MHARHLPPREMLSRHVTEIVQGVPPVFSSVSVISFGLPIAKETKRENAREKEGPSLRWNHTRWHGQTFINELSSHLVKVIEDLGYYAVAPEISPFFRIFTTPDGFASNWSQRHLAYAAGLGTFSLNEGFITRKGLALRFGSVVANLKLTPSERTYSHHLANCRFYATGECGKCIKRCPGDALSEKGHDKLKCRAVLYEQQKGWLEGEHGPGYIGSYAGCGLCQTASPVKAGFPWSAVRSSRNDARHAPSPVAPASLTLQELSSVVNKYN